MANSGPPIPSAGRGKGCLSGTGLAAGASFGGPGRNSHGVSRQDLVNVVGVERLKLHEGIGDSLHLLGMLLDQGLGALIALIHDGAYLVVNRLGRGFAVRTGAGDLPSEEEVLLASGS